MAAPLLLQWSTHWNHTVIGKKFVEKAELFLRFRGRAAVLMKMCSTHLLLRGLFSQQLLLRFREKKRKDC